MNFSEIALTLQLATSPAILISACGLLLLSMTNRLGRAIDRSRVLFQEWQENHQAHRGTLPFQLEVLGRRCKLIRGAIFWASLSLLFCAFLIMALFVLASVKWEGGLLVMILFSASMGALIISLVYFILDVNLSLRALQKEVDFSTH